jgi:hypothetical protein
MLSCNVIDNYCPDESDYITSLGLSTDAEKTAHQQAYRCGLFVSPTDDGSSFLYQIKQDYNLSSASDTTMAEALQAGKDWVFSNPDPDKLPPKPPYVNP